LYLLRKAWRQKNAAAFGLLLTFCWFILAILPAAASDEGLPHALRSILTLPPALILAALAGVWLYGVIKKHWGKMVSGALAIIFLVAVASYAYYEYFVLWAQNPN